MSTLAPSNYTVETIQYTNDGLILLDQTQLPHCIAYQTIQSVEACVAAIQSMVVRGAPAIGIAGAYGVVVSAKQHRASNDLSLLVGNIERDADRIAQARPTAVNLEWAIARMKSVLKQPVADSETLTALLEAEAQAIHQEDLAMCHAIGKHGASLIPKGACILTHCNAGGLATAGYGTALGVVRAAFEQDPSIRVFADETRPRLQGAKLTTWEMVQAGIPVTLISDNMSAWAMKQGKIDLVIVGADRIAANGDTANKIGTYLLALAAKAHHIPFYVAAPSSTIDRTLAHGDLIPIEERDAHELLSIGTESICCDGVNTYNPAFDVTPHPLITAIITETGVHQAPYSF